LPTNSPAVHFNSTPTKPACLDLSLESTHNITTCPPVYSLVLVTVGSLVSSRLASSLFPHKTWHSLYSLLVSYRNSSVFRTILLPYPPSVSFDFFFFSSPLLLSLTLWLTLTTQTHFRTIARQTPASSSYRRSTPPLELKLRRHRRYRKYPTTNSRLPLIIINQIIRIQTDSHTHT
jgi:hypothetical protein